MLPHRPSHYLLIACSTLLLCCSTRSIGGHDSASNDATIPSLTDIVDVTSTLPEVAPGGPDLVDVVTPDGLLDSGLDVSDTDHSDAAQPLSDATANKTTLRFIALGDTGEGNAAQYAVAAAIKAWCATAGCDFVVLLGDNIYDDGPQKLDDDQFQSKIVKPYENVDLPFYLIMGNHDYGKIIPDAEKVKYYLDFSKKFPKFQFPSNYFHHVQGPAHLLMMDTHEVFIGQGATQTGYWGPVIQNSLAAWRIAFGHHPYYSNGAHGDAGTYEGIPGVPIISGVWVKEFYEKVVCGKVDFLITGHDHTLQHLADTCNGTSLIVSGTGAKLTPFSDPGRHAVYYQTDKIEGFLWVQLTGDKAIFEFHSSTGKALHRCIYSKAKLPAPDSCQVLD